VIHSREVKLWGTPQRKFTFKTAKIPYIMIWQYWLGNTKPKKVFRMILNAFKKLLQNSKNLFNGIFYWLTDWPPAWCLQTCVTLQWLTLRAWFFCCSTLLQLERCLLPYHCTYNAFFMDLPWPSFVSHSFLFTTKSVNFVIDMWWLPFVMEIVCNFHSGYFDLKSLF